MNQEIDLVLPVPADLLAVARLTAATVAARAGFDVEEIEDLRLAVDELCISVLDPDLDGRLHLTYCLEEAGVEIRCHFEPTTSPGRGDGARPDGLSETILDALVDEHGRHGPGTAWLRKRRSGPGG